MIDLKKIKSGVWRSHSRANRRVLPQAIAAIPKEKRHAYGEAIAWRRRCVLPQAIAARRK